MSEPDKAVGDNFDARLLQALIARGVIVPAMASAIEVITIDKEADITVRGPRDAFSLDTKKFPSKNDPIFCHHEHHITSITAPSFCAMLDGTQALVITTAP